LRVVKHSTSLPVIQDPIVQDQPATPQRGRGTRPDRPGSNSPPVEETTAKRSPISLDEIDRRILMTVQENARISNVRLANRIGLSPAPCLRRVRVLESLGVIRRYAALVDARMVDLPTTVWTQVRLDLQVGRRFDAFEQHVRRLPEVLDCYLMAGRVDYLVRVAVRDVAACDRFLRTRFSQIEGVGSTNSTFASKVVKYSTELPLDPSSGKTPICACA
jgi:Lrp/AsnC family leucine-responsive transcriptional regulator